MQRTTGCIISIFSVITKDQMTGGNCTDLDTEHPEETNGHRVTVDAYDELRCTTDQIMQTRLVQKEQSPSLQAI